MAFLGEWAADGVCVGGLADLKGLYRGDFELFCASVVSRVVVPLCFVYI